MTIEKMNERHVPQIAALEKLCFPDPWSEKSIASELSNPLSHWLVALEGDQVVGYAGSQTVLDETDMMNIAVRSEYRRRGIAQRLVEQLAADLKAMGSKRLTLEVRASNQAAHRLYQKLGFAAVGRRPRYYLNPREDADILQLRLEEGKDVTA